MINTVYTDTLRLLSPESINKPLEALKASNKMLLRMDQQMSRLRLRRQQKQAVEDYDAENIDWGSLQVFTLSIEALRANPPVLDLLGVTITPATIARTLFSVVGGNAAAFTYRMLQKTAT